MQRSTNKTLKDMILESTELISKGKLKEYKELLNTVVDNKIDTKILCPRCGNDKFKIIDKRDTNGVIRRRRMCEECGNRISTVEVILAESK